MTKTKKIELISQLADILGELDWVFAIPTDDEVCKGLIIGEIDYVSAVVTAYYGNSVQIVTATDVNDGEPILNIDETKH